MGAVTGPGQWGLVPCLCYKCRAWKETKLKSEKFIIYVKKAAAFIPGLRLSVGSYTNHGISGGWMGILNREVEWGSWMVPLTRKLNGFEWGGWMGILIGEVEWGSLNGDLQLGSWTGIFNGEVEQGILNGAPFNSPIQDPHSKLFSFLVIVNYVHAQAHQSLLFNFRFRMYYKCERFQSAWGLKLNGVNGKIWTGRMGRLPIQDPRSPHSISPFRPFSFWPPCRLKHLIFK